MKKRLFIIILLLLWLLPVVRMEASNQINGIVLPSLIMSTLSPGLVIESVKLQESFLLEGVDFTQETQDIEMTANWAVNKEDIFAVLDQWYAAKERKLVLYPDIEAKIRKNEAQLFYLTVDTDQGEDIVAISFLYLMDEETRLFFFGNTGPGRTILPVWHRAITETDPDVKGYGLGTYLLELTVEELRENNYMHAFVEYQGGHPQGQQRWEKSYRDLGFKKVTIKNTDLTFFLLEPDILEKNKVSANNLAILKLQMKTEQVIESAI